MFLTLQQNKTKKEMGINDFTLVRLKHSLRSDNFTTTFTK